MGIRSWASAGLTALALAIVPAALSASDSATETNNDKASASKFAALKDVKAVAMSSTELKTVKGQHVHFVTVSNGKLHLAGNPEKMNNWSNLGGTDGFPVAPSYKGLCRAHGNGGIFIPTAGPVTVECPPGS